MTPAEYEYYMKYRKRPGSVPPMPPEFDLPPVMNDAGQRWIPEDSWKVMNYPLKHPDAISFSDPLNEYDQVSNYTPWGRQVPVDPVDYLPFTSARERIARSLAE